MKTVDELKSAFAVYYQEMERCEQADAYWAHLHLVVVLPDICAALEGLGGVGARYVSWCEAYFPQNPRLTPGDRFQMRNALLHEGTTLPTNRRSDPRQRTQYSSFSFVKPGATNVQVHQNVSPDGVNITIDVQELAAETRQAMEHWFGELQRDPSLNAYVERNLSKLAREQEKLSQVPVSTAGGHISVITQIHNTTSST